MAAAAEDKKRLEELVAALERVELARPNALPMIIPEIREFTGAYSATAYQVKVNRDYIELEGPAPSYADRVETGGWRRLRDYVRASPHQWGGYNPRTPEAGQRNRLITIDDPTKILRGTVPVPRNVSPLLLPALQRHIGILESMGWARPHARVLVCDGARLLAYVGIVDDVQPNRRQQMILRALIPALRRRMIVEDRIRSGEAWRSALDVALEQIGAPAFVLDHEGTIVAINKAGQSWYDRDRQGVGELLRTRPPGLELTPFSGDGVRGSLCVYRGAALEHDPRVAAAAGRWRLTPRQTEVLALLARGHTNSRIAAELGCVEGTVEIHVSRILSRAQVASRAALIAELFWSRAPA